MEQKINLFISLSLVVVVTMLLIVFSNNVQEHQSSLTGMVVGTQANLAQQSFSEHNLGGADVNFLEANNLRLLDENEFVIVFEPDMNPSSEPGILTAELTDGTLINIEVNKGGTISITEGSAENNVYISNANKIYDKNTIDQNTLIQLSPIQEDITNRKSENILKLRNLFEDDEELIPVIITFNLPMDFIEANYAQEYAQYEQFFNQAKTFLSQLFSGVSDSSSINLDLKLINGVSAKIDKKTLNILSSFPNVLNIEYDFEVNLFLDKSADEIGATDKWGLITQEGLPLTGQGVTVAVLDTGVDYTHPDLGGCFGPNCKVTKGYDFINDDVDPMDDHGHGTHVAGTIAANGQLKGVAPDAEIWAYKVLSASGGGSISGIIAAIEHATDPNGDGSFDDGADIISMSLGGPAGANLDALALAVEASTEVGVVHVIAAGNSGPHARTIGTPAIAPSSITVAAACPPHSNIAPSNRCGESPIALFSSRGPVIMNGVDHEKPDISAPGVLICAARYDSFSSDTCFGTQNIRISGTSMATPHVSGAVALIKQVYPDMSPLEIKNLIKDSAIDLNLPYDEQGAGFITLDNIVTATKFNFNPVNIEFVSDPSLKFYDEEKTISVSSETNYDSVNLVIENDVLGVELTLDKTSINLQNGQQAQFTANVMIDNDVASAGKYYAFVQLHAGNEYLGKIPLRLNIQPTVIINETNLDFGINNPEFSGMWTSDTKTVQITNLRVDKQRTVSHALSGFPTSVSLSESNSQVTINPGETKEIPLTLNANNANLENGVYSGNILLNFEDNQQNVINAEFTKYYILMLKDISRADKFVMVISNKNTGETYKTIYPENELMLYLDSLNNEFDVSIQYRSEIDRNTTPDTHTSRYVVIENIIQDESIKVVEYSIEDAKNEYVLNFLRKDGSLFYGGELSYFFVVPKTTGTQIISRSFNYPPTGILDRTKVYISDVSDNYIISRADIRSNIVGNDRVYYVVGHELHDGINANLVVTPNYQEYEKLEFTQAYLTDALLSTSFALNPSYSTNLWFTFFNMQTPFSNIVYYNNFSNKYFGRSVIDANNFACEEQSPCFSNVRTVYLNLSNKESRSSVTNNLEDLFVYDDYVLKGLGPAFWTGYFNNRYSLIELKDYYNSVAYVTNQGLIHKPRNEIDYELIRVSDNVVVLEGTFPTIHYIGSSLIAQSRIFMQSPQDTYKFVKEFEYMTSQGLVEVGFIEAIFSTTGSNKNPPRIANLEFFSNGIRSEKYSTQGTNELIFLINPVGGEIVETKLYYSSNNMNYQEVELILDDSNYVAVLEDLDVNNKLWLRIESVDSSNNSLKYTFSMPVDGASVDFSDLTVNIMGEGSVKGNNINCEFNDAPCIISRPSGTQISLSATQGMGFEFTSWQGACEGTSNCVFTLDDDKTVTATFNEMDVSTKELTININGEGVVLVDSFECGSDDAPCTISRDEGANVVLEASSSEGYVFDSWSDVCSNEDVALNVCLITLDDDETVEANFVTEEILLHNFTLTIDGEGSIVADAGSSLGSFTCTNEDSPCTYNLPENTTLFLGPVASENYEFELWAGDCSNNDLVCSITLNSNKQVGAKFKQTITNKTLILDIEGTGSILVDGYECDSDDAPCTISRNEGTQLVLEASSADEYVFDSWSGACSNEGVALNICTLTLDDDLTAKATFKEELSEFDLTIVVEGQGNVKGDGVSCDVSQSPCIISRPEGFVLNLDARPHNGFEFDSWSDSCEGETNCAITFDSNKNVKASFKEYVPPKGTLYVMPQGEGRVMGENIECDETRCEYEILIGDEVTLTATPFDGAVFDSWVGACSGYDDTCEFVMDDEIRVIAKFEQEEPSTGLLNININGLGLVTGEGVECSSDTSPCSFDLEMDSTIVLTAQSATGDGFDYWEGACAGTTNDCALVLNTNKDVVANFKTKPVRNLPQTPINFDGLGVSTSSIQLNWEYDGDADVDAFVLERKSSINSQWVVVENIPSSEYELVDEDLASGIFRGRTYYYRIKSTNNFGGSDYSEEINVATCSLFNRWGVGAC
ncbi:MAG: S8 family serine peptidase [Candidatus Woesearchaeota archaeon]